MAKTFDLKHFIFGLSAESIKHYCKNNKLDFATTDDDNIHEAFEKFYFGLEQEMQRKIEADFSEANDLTPGTATEMLTEYGSQSGIVFPAGFKDFAQNDKSLWFFLEKRDIFDRVFQETDFQDMTGWRYVKSVAKEISDLDGKTEKLGKAIADFLMGTRLKGRYCFVRSHNQENVIYFTAFPEGYTHAELEYNTPQQMRRSLTKPADRVYFSYDQTTGRIGVRAKGTKQTKSEYQNIFNNIILENFEVLDDDRIFDLNILKNPEFSFDATSEYRMKYARVKTLMIKAVDNTWRLTIDVYDDDKHDVVEIHQKMKSLNLHPDKYLIQQAIIKVQFEDSGIYRSRDSVTFRLSWPNSHNLTNKKRDLVVKELLRHWKLDVQK